MLSSNYIAATHNVTHFPCTSTYTTHPAIHPPPPQLPSTILLCTQLTNTKHSQQNGTRCRDGVNVLWCRSYLVRLVFEHSIPTCACFHLENSFVTCYTLRLVTISKMHCSSNCKTSTVGLSPSPAVIKAEPIVLNILMCQYMLRQDWSQQTKETVYPPLFFPTLQMGRKSGLHSFSPSVRWKSESVPPTLFSHCNKMEKKSVPPTLFFPIIEGEKVQRVRNYPYPYMLF